MSIKKFARDTRKPLHEILEDSIHDTVEVDRKKTNDDLDLLRQENDSFYYRSILLFLIRAEEEYTSDEIKDWLHKKLL